MRLWTYPDSPRVTLHEKPTYPNNLLIEARIDGRHAGQFWMRIDRLPGSPISDLTVNHYCHGFGLGLKMMAAMAELVGEHGQTWLEVLVRDGNEAALRRYAQLGWHCLAHEQDGKDNPAYLLHRLDLKNPIAA